MKTQNIALLTGFILALPSLGVASGFIGSVSFTDEERALHLQGSQQILGEAASCVQKHLNQHRTFFRKWGISPYFGDKNPFARMNDSERRAYLRSLRKPESLAKEMQNISCVGMALKCLGLGFESAGQAATWKRIKTFTQANGTDGTALQDALQELGWKIYYWNPKPALNASQDISDKEQFPTDRGAWGWHVSRYQGVIGPKHMYYDNQVDNWSRLVDFRTSLPADFKKVPFFIGTAHTGYHVFPGVLGGVIEAHSSRQLWDPNTVEASEFNPLKNGGGPRGHYFSGLIAIPPGYDF